MSAVSPAAPVDAASALYERHRGRVLRFCQGRLASREDAEDATQTTFLNAVGALRRGTVPRAEAAWLLRIAENVCHHRHRTAVRRRESVCDPTVLEGVVEAAPGRPDELIHLAAGLESLPERQRHALLLREWQGLSYHEIGAELGVSHSAVETLLFRARRGLARALERDGKRRGGLGLFGWLKTAVGGVTGLKVAAAVVVAGVAVVPARDAPALAPEPAAQPRAAVAVVAPATMPATQPATAVAARRAVAAPKPAGRHTTSRPSAARGDRPAAVESGPTAVPTPAPVPAPGPPHPPPPSAAPMPTPTAVTPATLPLDPPVQLPALPAPTLPDVTDALPAAPLPPLPELPRLPDVPVPKLQVPVLP